MPFYTHFMNVNGTVTFTNHWVPACFPSPVMPPSVYFPSPVMPRSTWTTSHNYNCIQPTAPEFHVNPKQLPATVMLANTDDASDVASTPEDGGDAAGMMRMQNGRRRNRQKGHKQFHLQASQPLLLLWRKGNPGAPSSAIDACESDRTHRNIRVHMRRTPGSRRWRAQEARGVSLLGSPPCPGAGSAAAQQHVAPAARGWGAQ